MLNLKRILMTLQTITIFHKINSCPNCSIFIAIKLQQSTSRSAVMMGWFFSISGTLRGKGVQTGASITLQIALCFLSLCGEKPSLRFLPRASKVGIDTTPLCAPLHHHHNHTLWRCNLYSVQWLKIDRHGLSVWGQIKENN